MNITEELREHIHKKCVAWTSELLPIADRIDEEHERQLEVLYRDMSDAEYVKLPKDADGEYIHVGDLMVSAKGHFDGCHKVKNLVLVKCNGELSWSCQLYGVGVWDTYFALGNLRHHHAPTVEDVLREFADEVQRCCDTADTIAEYAAKLRLAGDGDE